MCAAVDGEDHLADFDFFTLLHHYVFDGAADGRRDLDHSFVGLELHHGLAFSDSGSRRNHQADEVALMYVFAKLGKFKFSQQ